MKKVFVACGASTPVINKYLEIAKEIGKYLAINGYAYGQGGYVETNSLMGDSFHSYVDNGGKHITFICISRFADDIKDYEDIAEKITLVKGPNELVEAISSWADIEIFLPGGNGTLHELTSALEIRDIANNSVKLIIFNVDGYYNDLINLLKNMNEKGLLRKNFLDDNITIINNMKELEKIL